MQKENSPLITLSGTVEAIVYQNADSGYVVMELDTGATLETVVGEIPGVTAGEELSVTGRYSTHPTYGQQFRAEVCERHMPATSTAILKYLSSGIIKGIGPALARRIVDRFGDGTLEVIEKDHEKLSEVRGLSQAKAADIFDQYRRIFGLRSVMLYLAKFGVDSSSSIRIWKLWGALTKDMVESNPYLLMNEPVELAFETADVIATSLGFSPEDPRRLRAGLSRVLTHNLRNGHTCLPRNRLLATAAEMLDVAGEEELLENALEEASRDCEIVSDTFDGREFIYLARLYEAETFIAGRIALLLCATPPGEAPDFSKEIEGLQKSLGIEYDPLQKRAVAMALSSRIFILTGGPGTGKTTALNAILTLLEGRGEKVALAAPTGRAAKRISEVTGREASTVHRLLEVDFRDPDTGRHKFKRDEANPLRVNAIILDEVSMVDTPLMQSLLKAMRMSCRLILVGDPNQLPSVGPGNLLRDLIESDVIPTLHLSRIFRQAELSAIVTGAHAIVAGETPPLNLRDSDFFFLEQSGSYQDTLSTVADLCLRRLPAAYGYDPVTDIQVIAPSRVGALGTVELNRALQQALNPKDAMKAQFLFGSVTFREGDKVMQVKNNYDIPWRRDNGENGAGVFNGDIGLVEMIDRPSQTILVRFDDRVAQYSIDMADEIEHAYAVTVHKSQGSEFEAVIIPLMSYHDKLYYRNILYTGVTRAKKLLIILGRPDTVRRMVDNDRKVLRYTRLKDLLEQSVSGQKP
ncbi:MAG: ATP-dependent RecD-like DNA helicase [Oscillospiraceae bacterium]|nr:ATP-dependent RecD-like DNA helicase [Oscillospiraceae bacterium]